MVCLELMSLRMTRDVFCVLNDSALVSWHSKNAIASRGRKFAFLSVGLRKHMISNSILNLSLCAKSTDDFHEISMMKYSNFNFLEINVFLDFER